MQSVAHVHIFSREFVLLFHQLIYMEISFFSVRTVLVAFQKGDELLKKIGFNKTGCSNPIINVVLFLDSKYFLSRDLSSHFIQVLA